MNERIRELAEQAGADIWGDQVSSGKYFDIEKFSELIVRECSSFVYNYPEKYLTRNQAREICLSMEDYFGVAE